jgi:hypothetical protein
MRLRKRWLILLALLWLAAGAAVSLNRLQAAGGLTPKAYLPLVINDCDDFYDHFNDPASGWQVLDDALVQLAYVNGEYQIFSKQAGYVFRPLAPTYARVNYMVEADARFAAQPTDGLYGLVFGAITQGDEVTQYYLFAIEPDDQEYRLYRKETDGSFTTLIASTFSAAINQGTAVNHLAAIRNGNDITLAVNGVTLTTTSDSLISGPTFTGLALSPRSANPQADGRFDHFHLSICVPDSSHAAAAFSQGLPAPAASYDAFAPED